MELENSRFLLINNVYYVEFDGSICGSVFLLDTNFSYQFYSLEYFLN